MKEICLLNKGDNIEKLNYKLGLNIDNFVCSDSDNVFNYKFLTIKDGDSSIKFVRNYNPYYIIKSGELSKINTMEFEILNRDADDIILSKNCGIKYSVHPLENLEDIAIKFGVGVEDIRKTNQLNTNKLFVGQILII